MFLELSWNVLGVGDVTLNFCLILAEIFVELTRKGYDFDNLISSESKLGQIYYLE